MYDFFTLLRFRILLTGLLLRSAIILHCQQSPGRLDSESNEYQMATESVTPHFLAGTDPRHGFHQVLPFYRESARVILDCAQ